MMSLEALGGGGSENGSLLGGGGSEIGSLLGGGGSEIGLLRGGGGGSEIGLLFGNCLENNCLDGGDNITSLPGINALAAVTDGDTTAALLTLVEKSTALPFEDFPMFMLIELLPAGVFAVGVFLISTSCAFLNLSNTFPTCSDSVFLP